jgi:FMN-dependent NADH-azoreductase
MAHILHIDSSSRGDRSISRTLGGEFIQAWKEAHPGDTVTYRDLGHHPLPFVSEAWIAASFSAPSEHTPEMAAAIQLSNDLVDEFLAADRYVFGVPMNNFTIPAVFKAYLDQVIRMGRTFTVTPEGGFQGLVEPGKKMLIVSPRSGTYDPGTPTAVFDFHTPYINAIFNFIGISDITFVKVEGLAFGDEYREKTMTSARETLKSAVATW